MTVFLIVYFYTKHASQYAQSFVIDKATHKALAFAKVTVWSAKNRMSVAQKATSFEGQFTCLVSRGDYYVTIERRNDRGAYELVYTSRVFAVRDGYIGKRFEV